MSNETYVCLNCEASGSKEITTTLDKHGKCPRCGSDSVISEALLLEAAKKATAAPVDRTRSETGEIRQQPPITSGVVRNPKYKESRLEYSAPMKVFLKRNKFDDVLAWWDGWGWSLEWSIGKPDKDLTLQRSQWKEDGTMLEHCVVTLVNESGEQRQITFFIDPTDVGMVEVGEVIPYKRQRV